VAGILCLKETRNSTHNIVKVHLSESAVSSFIGRDGLLIFHV
jgi:hypothetical protein